MNSVFTQILTILLVSGLSVVNSAVIEQAAVNTWELFPATPVLPSTTTPATISDSNGAKLWLQKYNEAAGGTPVVFIHGGGGYSAYFGDVIKKMVAAGRYCIAVDRRGHGLSTFVATDVWTFDMFANEIHAQLKSIGVTKADWVGWSDGAATTYAALQNPTIDPTINKAYVFAGFMVPKDTNSTYASSTMYTKFVDRIKVEYAKLQPSASFDKFATLLTTLESTLPQFTTAGLGKIDGKKVAVVYADHDEAVNLDVPAKLHAAIPGSTLLQLTEVSHFAPMQNATQFTASLQTFLNA